MEVGTTGALREGMTDSTRGIDVLRSQLLDEHVQLAALCQRVVATFEEGDREACDATFRELERSLEEHLAFEERELLPALARVDRPEADALLEEHRTIRSRLTDLGVHVDLHAARASAVKQLVLDLGAHARREGELLYRWAGEAFDEPTRRNWMRRLRTW